MLRRFSLVYCVSQALWVLGLFLVDDYLALQLPSSAMACLTLAGTAFVAFCGFRATGRHTEWPKSESAGPLLVNSALIALQVLASYAGLGLVGAAGATLALGCARYETVAGMIPQAKSFSLRSRKWRGLLLLLACYAVLAFIAVPHEPLLVLATVQQAPATAVARRLADASAAAMASTTAAAAAAQSAAAQSALMPQGLGGLVCLLAAVVAARVQQRRVPVAEDLKGVHPLSWGLAAALCLPLALVQLAAFDAPPGYRLSLGGLLLAVALAALGTAASHFSAHRLRRASRDDAPAVAALTHTGFVVAVCSLFALNLGVDGTVSVAYAVLAGGIYLATRAIDAADRGAGAGGMLPVHTGAPAAASAETGLALALSVVHQIASDSSSKKLLGFLCCTLAFMVVELLYGMWTNSLSLISDGFHMLFDCTALAIALYCTVMAKWPASRKYTYGYGRFQVLSGHVNGVFLVLTAIFILLESIERLLDPPAVKTERLLLVAVFGLCVNLVGLYAFHDHHGHSHSHGAGECDGAHGDEHDDLSTYGVFLHILADALGSVGVIISSLLIQFFGWTVSDPICSIIISLLIAGSVVPLLRNSSQILMHRAPKSFSRRVARRELEKILALSGVLSVERAMTFTQDDATNVIALHLTAAPNANEQVVRALAAAILRDAGFARVSVQVAKPPAGDAPAASSSAASPARALSSAGLLDSPALLARAVTAAQ